MHYDGEQHQEGSMVVYNFKISSQEAEEGGLKAREAWGYLVRIVWKYKTEKVINKKEMGSGRERWREEREKWKKKDQKSVKDLQS